MAADHADIRVPLECREMIRAGALLAISTSRWQGQPGDDDPAVADRPARPAGGRPRAPRQGRMGGDHSADRGNASPRRAADLRAWHLLPVPRLRASPPSEFGQPARSSPAGGRARATTWKAHTPRSRSASSTAPSGAAGSEGWNVERFQDSTGLKIVHEGGLKDELPPMPKFLNRLLALPIAEQNQLFAELEERIAANIEQAIEAAATRSGSRR